MLKKIGTMARRDIELMLGQGFPRNLGQGQEKLADKKLDFADFGNEKEYYEKGRAMLACFTEGGTMPGIT